MSDLLKNNPELTKVDVTFEGIGSLKAVLKSSQLSLSVTGQQTQSSMYYCTFESGSFQYSVGDMSVRGFSH